MNEDSVNKCFVFILFGCCLAYFPHRRCLIDSIFKKMNVSLEFCQSSVHVSISTYTTKLRWKKASSFAHSQDSLNEHTQQIHLCIRCNSCALFMSEWHVCIVGLLVDWVLRPFSSVYGYIEITDDDNDEIENPSFISRTTVLCTSHTR